MNKQMEQRIIEMIEQMIDHTLHKEQWETPFSELGVDSLMALELAVYIEREFGIRLSEDELTGLHHLSGLLSLLRTKVAG